MHSVGGVPVVHTLFSHAGIARFPTHASGPFHPKVSSPTMAKNRLLLRCFLFAMTLALAAQSAWCQKPEVLESAHYRIFYQKQNAELAGKVLEIAEQVWPTLARAYDAYKHYQRIDVFLTDYGDDANGFAIYEFSRVEIFVPHINWVMRGRGNWVGNVVTHELAHIFTLRQQAGTSLEEKPRNPKAIPIRKHEFVMVISCSTC